MSIDTILETYKNRVFRFNLKMNKIKRRLILISILRFVFFVVSSILFVFLVKKFNWILLISFLLFISFFIFLVVYYIKRTEILNHIGNLIRINEDQIKANNHDYSVFKAGSHYENRDHDYSYDLDLFGKGSLFQYLNRTVTIVGSDLLAKRLVNTSAANQDSIINTQESISEISEKVV